MERSSDVRAKGGALSRRQLLRSAGLAAGGLGLTWFIGCDESPRPAAVVTSPPTAATPPGSAASTRGTFQQLNPSGASPAPRRDHTLTANETGTHVYVFGGRSDSGEFADLWDYDISANTWRLIPVSSAPPARFGHNALWDKRKNRLLIFGGQAGGSFFADVWAYSFSAGNWSRPAESGPAPRYGAGSAMLGDNALFISHGFTNSGRFDDSWTFSLESDSWADVSGQGERPLRRCLLRTAADPTRDRLLLFGGQSNEAPFLDDLWEFKPASRSWRRLAAQGPSARNLYALAATQTSQLLLFGGNTMSGVDNQTWLLDMASDSWRRVDVSGSLPAARQSHDAVWLHSRDMMLVFGGQSQAGALADLWELRLA